MADKPPLFVGEIQPKYSGPSRVAMTGDMDLAAEYKPRAMEMLAQLVNEWNAAKLVVTSKPGSAEDSQGFRTARDRIQVGEMVVEIRCVVNDQQRSAHIHAANPKAEQASKEKEEKKPKTEPKPYLWVGIRPLSGGTMQGVPHEEYDRSYQPGADNWRGFSYYGGNVSDGGYFYSMWYLLPERFLKPYLFEPGLRGAIGPSGEYRGVLYNHYSPFSEQPMYEGYGGPQDYNEKVLAQSSKVRMSLDDDGSPIFMCTEYGTFGSYGLWNTRSLDPGKPKEERGEWYCAFWVDPDRSSSPSMAYGDPTQFGGFVKQQYLAGEYQLVVGVSSASLPLPFVPPERTLVYEVEVRTFKAPHTITSRFQFTATEGSQYFRDRFPNGFYAEGMPDVQNGANTFGPAWSQNDVIKCSPFAPPERLPSFKPAWGFD